MDGLAEELLTSKKTCSRSTTARRKAGSTYGPGTVTVNFDV
jgi:hypothetical protein